MRKLVLDELGRLSIEAYKKLPKYPVSIVLDNIRSGMNVGSVFRSVDAFKMKHIYLTGITPQPPHREILKTAIGATQSVSWTYHPDVVGLINDLKEKGSRIAMVEQTSDSVSLEKVNFDVDQHLVFVFGNEVNGITPGVLPIADLAVEIPQFGTKHSLNVAVATGIVLWHYVAKYLSD